MMQLSEWPNWTQWVLLQTVALDWKMVPIGAGTYMIAAHRRLQRAVGVDEEGILDIGTSKRLRMRLNEFWQCAKNSKRRGHMAGWRFAEYNMTKHFPLETLHVCWRPAETADEAAYEEARLIDEYVHQHMESPPLNYSASWRHL
jgi:hypothetical protein